MASERKFITEKIRRVLLKEYVMKDVGRAGFGGLEVQRTPMGTRVTLITERPGLVIGRRGESIKNLTHAIEQRFNFPNPQIEVQEVENPNLNAQIMAEKLANALERGWHFRRAGHSTVRRIMESGARGCQVMLAGKLTGRRHRREKFKNGHIKFCGQPKLDFMDKGYTIARMKPGVIGVSVQIMHPDAKLPDEISIIPPPAVVPTVEVAPVEHMEQEAEKAQETGAAEAVEELKKAAEEDTKVKKPASRAKKKDSATEEAKKPRKRPAKKKETPAAEKAPEPKAEPEKETPAAEKVVEPKAEPEKETPAAEKVVEPKAEPEKETEPETEKSAEDGDQPEEK